MKSGFALKRTIELPKAGHVPAVLRNRRKSFGSGFWFLMLLMISSFGTNAAPFCNDQDDRGLMPAVTLFFENQTVCRGETFSISLQSSPFNGLSSFYIRVRFNPQQLSFQISENYVSSIPNFSPEVSFPSPGIVQLIYNSPYQLNFEGGNVIEFFFIALTEGTTSLTLEESTVFRNLAGDASPIVRHPGIVQINNGPDFSVYGPNNTVFESFKYCRDNELDFRVLAQASSFMVLWKIPNNALITGERLSGVRAKMEHNGDMYITVSGPDGCNREKIIGLEVFECGLRPILPNAFKPTSDITVNKTFKPIFTKEQPYLYIMQIFDRWGKLVFETNSLSEGWDGTFGSQISETGLYSYIITFSMAPNAAFGRFTSTERGTVLLIR